MSQARGNNAGVHPTHAQQVALAGLSQGLCFRECVDGSVSTTLVWPVRTFATFLTAPFRPSACPEAEASASRPSSKPACNLDAYEHVLLMSSRGPRQRRLATNTCDICMRYDVFRMPVIAPGRQRHMHDRACMIEYVHRHTREMRERCSVRQR